MGKGYPNTKGPISTRFRSTIKPLLVDRQVPRLAWLVCFCVLGILAVALGMSLHDPDPPMRWARIWGGPTEGPAPLTLRIELLSAGPESSDAGARSGSLTINSGSRRLALAFDVDNSTYVRLAPTGSDPLVTVEVDGAVVAAGRLRLARNSFWQRRRSRGGFWHGRTDGALRIAAGCREGVFVLGKPGQIGLIVTDADRKPVRTDLTIELEGLEVSGRGSRALVRTDERGRASLPVTPTDLAASLRITIASHTAQAASYFSSVPIESTALFGRVRDNAIVVDSLIPTSKAYFSLVNEQGSWGFGKLDLNCAPNGRCHGELPLLELPTLPAWLMLGGEPRLDGPNVVGWPIAASESDFVMESVSVPSQLLLDGRPLAVTAAERIRTARFNRILGGTAIASAALLLTIAVHLVHARRKLDAFEHALRIDLPVGVIERRSPWLVAILLLAVLGLAAIVSWARFTYLHD